ncbi:hexose kinase [Agrococcus sp. 1P02AA]|uniref:1-phosphofructokinase family hexose kinase n=1 Tax=Agrococcus sp. 1P02AA TaxID=3132259 RepID=UPI0039A4FD87
MSGADGERAADEREPAALGLGAQGPSPILCVTTNPAIDITYAMDELRPGTSHRVETGLARAGGKGVNVARVLHQHDEAAMVIAPIGGPVRVLFVHDLERSGIPHRLVEVAAPTRRTTAIVTPAGTTNLNERGAAIGAEDWQRLLTIVRAQAPAARIVVSSGSLPPDTPPGFCSSVVDVAVAAGRPCIIDVGGEQLRAAVAAGATAVKPNRHELLDAMGGTDPLDAARRLAAEGTGTVFASLDIEGMLAVLPDGRAWHAQLGRVLEGNPTGAGDAAVAALALAIADGETLEAQLARATAWSSAAVLAPQAGSIVDPAELEPRIRITPIG